MPERTYHPRFTIKFLIDILKERKSCHSLCFLPKKRFLVQGIGSIVSGKIDGRKVSGQFQKRTSGSQSTLLNFTKMANDFEAVGRQYRQNQRFLSA